MPLPPRWTTPASAMNDTKAAATAASMALPPRRNISAPAAAVSLSPAAITPLVIGLLALMGVDELWMTNDKWQVRRMAGEGPI